MRHSLPTSITVIMALLFVSFEVHANPTPPKPKASLPLKGPRLPVYRWNQDDAVDLNWSPSWKEIAHDFRVVDLHVYRYPFTNSYADEGRDIEHGVLSQLQSAGYKISTFSWAPQSFITGFHAKRGKELIVGVWVDGITLDWGHVAPVTPQSKLDDGLIDAVYDGDVDAAKRFLANGANPHAKDYSGDFVLKVAADRNRIAIIKLLLAARKTEPSISYTNETLGALKVASYKNYPEIVQAIINDGVTPYQIGIAMKMTVSFGSAGSTDVVKVLLPFVSQYDIDANLVTAVYAYFYFGSVIQYPDIVKLLLTRKPSQSALNKSLLTAARYDQVEGIVPMLIAGGADVDVRNEKGETAILRAARNGWNKEQPDVLALLKAGADPNLGDNNGTTPLMRAAVYNSTETVKLLLAHGANPNTRNKAGHNAIYFIQRFMKSNPPKETQQRLMENQQIIENAMKQSVEP